MELGVKFAIENSFDEARSCLMDALLVAREREYYGVANLVGCALDRLETIGKLTGERISVTGASRTDAGVHALGQVADGPGDQPRNGPHGHGHHQDGGGEDDQQASSQQGQGIRQLPDAGHQHQCAVFPAALIQERRGIDPRPGRRGRLPRVKAVRLNGVPVKDGVDFHLIDAFPDPPVIGIHHNFAVTVSD